MVRLGHVSASFWSYGRGIRTLFHFISFHYGLIKVRNTQIYLIWILLLKNVHFRGFCHILGLQLSRIHNFNVKCTIHIINLVRTTKRTVSLSRKRWKPEKNILSMCYTKKSQKPPLDTFFVQILGIFWLKTFHVEVS